MSKTGPTRRTSQRLVFCSRRRRKARGFKGRDIIMTNADDLLQGVWDYPLYEAIYSRRSRRFGLGFEAAEGPFRYKSEQPAVPLSEFEEALLVAAGFGVTGIPLW